MKDATLSLITEIVENRFGFITDADINALLADPALLHAKVLLRCDADRKVVSLHEVPAAVEAAGDSLRDVSFTANQCDTFRAYA